MNYLATGCGDNNEITEADGHFVLDGRESPQGACVITDLDAPEPEGDYTVEVRRAFLEGLRLGMRLRRYISDISALE